MDDPPPQLRDRLVDVALAMLEDGATDLTLRGVARAAGGSAMAPYRHFADRAALMGAVAARGLAALHDALAAADRAAGGDRAATAALVAQGLDYVAFAQARPALFRLMFADPAVSAPPKDGDADCAYGALSRRVATIVGPGAADAALACWAIVHGLAMLTLDARLPADVAMRRRVLEGFAAGLNRPGA